MEVIYGIDCPTPDNTVSFSLFSEVGTAQKLESTSRSPKKLSKT